MYQSKQELQFSPINQAYNTVFCPHKLSLGLVVPIENYAQSSVPTMQQQMEVIQLAEALGFASVWLRDVPFHVPNFGDAGQLYDPFVYLGLLTGQTQSIALGVASIILPLRHPAHVAKAASSVDVLSGGRLLLGVASGDRPEEYPALKMSYTERGQRFREAFEYIQRMSEAYPEFENDYGQIRGHIDMLPKPTGTQLPLLITGGSQQTPEWLASHGNGWMVYPRHKHLQSKIIKEWRERIRKLKRPDQPVMEPLYIDLVADPNAPAQSIHLGYRLGVNTLINYLKERQAIGVNHVALNLRFNQADIQTTMQELADKVLPHFLS